MARALSRLGKRVRALRLDRDLTQERAAETAKLDEKHWQDIEGARTNPTLATLVGIARALKVTLSELFENGGERGGGEHAAARPQAPVKGPARAPRPSRRGGARGRGSSDSGAT